MSRLGLRTQLALALVGVALLAVGMATVLSNRGLHPRLTDAAEARLQRGAVHMAQLAADVYRRDGAWTADATRALEGLARLDGLELSVASAAPAADRAESTATAPVVIRGRRVGYVSVSPLGGDVLTPEDEHLQRSLDRLHLVAGAISVAGALLVAFMLAQALSRPLRRIRLTAERIGRGDLDARVPADGDDELRAVGHALNQLAETLQREEELRKANVADLAHELRTPVNGLLGRIEAAQDGVLPDAANLEAMHAEAIRLSRLLDDLARLAEAERPGLLLQKSETDLGVIAAEIADQWRPRFAEKQIELDVRGDSVRVSGDETRLGQVVDNLLANALRYSDRGGHVVVRAANENGSAVLEVADTGTGIAAADLPHVFKRFWRGEKSRSRATGGAGIGLAIVAELVRAHGGRVEVDSEIGRGSRFRILLPAVRRSTEGRYH